MKVQGICSVCGEPVPVKAGDVAAKHKRRLGLSLQNAACEGSGKVADVPAWIAAEEKRAADIWPTIAPRQKSARADYDAALDRIAASEKDARETSLAMMKLKATRRKAGAL